MVEEAGDEELRRAVGLLLGVEAAGPKLESHAGGCLLEDAQRLLRRVPVRLPLRLGVGVEEPGGGPPPRPHRHLRPLARLGARPRASPRRDRAR